MLVFKHKEHTAYELKKKVVFIKNHNKLLFWHKGKLVPNFRFTIKLHSWRFFHLLIRLPFIYLEKNNGGWKVGTPNNYLWVVR